MKARMVPVILGVVLAVPVSTRAQGPWGYFRIPDLTQDQKARMDTLWVAWVRETMAHRAALQQATVELQVQVSEDNPDPAAIRQAIERVTSLKGLMLDAEVRLVMEVKKVLRPEQVRWFNLDLLSRSRFSEKFVDPDQPMAGGLGRGGFPGGPGPGPGGPAQGGPAVWPQGPGPVGPSQGGPGAGPRGPVGPGGWCWPDDPTDDDEPPPPPVKGKRSK